MDNSSLNVTDTNMNIAIETGGFRVYGNKQATLSATNFNTIANLNLYPNPTSGSFIINEQVSKVEIYSITGQMVKYFDAIPSEEYQFNVNDLSKGVYLVKAIDSNNSSKTLKLIKQ